ncbi:MAG: ABC transporter ATP-binding protein [Gemmobacter sp.]
MQGLAFDGISKRFGDTVAVDGLSLTIAPGEFVALVGPSGCGKTTSLRILAGLEEASGGRVFVDGRDVTDLPARDRNLAMVFQSYALYPHLTAAENIGFALSLRGVPRAQIVERVRSAADRLGIAHLLHRRPKELSGGQRQRVAVARCIVREPAAFLFDEPLSNLDAKLRATARVEIAKLQKGLGITTLYVTHDQVEAMTMADRVVLMDGGRIRQAGAPMELYHNPCDLFVATFLGAPPMNLLPADVTAEGGQSALHVGGATLALAGGIAPGPATVGIRPEALALGEGAGGGLTLAGRVQHVEHLGAETLVEVAVGGLAAGHAAVTLTARLPGTRAIARGEGAVLSAAPEALHLFDDAGRAVPLRRAA